MWNIETPVQALCQRAAWLVSQTSWASSTPNRKPSTEMHLEGYPCCSRRDGCFWRKPWMQDQLCTLERGRGQDSAWVSSAVSKFPDRDPQTSAECFTLWGGSGWDCNSPNLTNRSRDTGCKPVEGTQETETGEEFPIDMMWSRLSLNLREKNWTPYQWFILPTGRSPLTLPVCILLPCL